MHSSTSITIVVPSSYSTDSLFNSLHGYSEDLSKEYWTTQHRDDTATLMLDECPIDYGDAEELPDYICNVLIPALRNEEFSLRISFTLINTDGHFEWIRDYKDHKLCCSYQEDIIDDVICCPDCGCPIDLESERRDNGEVTCGECGCELTVDSDIVYKNWVIIVG